MPTTIIKRIEPHSTLAVTWPGHTCYAELPGADERGSGGIKTFRDEIAAHAWLCEQGYRQSGDLSSDEYSRVGTSLLRRLRALKHINFEEPSR